jgi:predicted nucleic acid-binding protein
VTPERPFLLDTSALMALIEDEEGAERVESILRTEVVLIPWIDLLEIHYISTRRHGAAEADRRYGLISQLAASMLWDNDERLVLTASRLKAAHRLSLADALIAAHCVRHDAVLVHRDPEYQVLEKELRMEMLPGGAG